MRGAITAQDVLRHSITILRFWGPSAYFRCLRAMISRHPTTFLEALYPGQRRAT